MEIIKPGTRKKIGYSIYKKELLKTAALFCIHLKLITPEFFILRGEICFYKIEQHWVIGLQFCPCIYLVVHAISGNGFYIAIEPALHSFCPILSYI